MMNRILVLMIAIMMAACSSNGVNRGDKEVTIKISYGLIKEKESVQLDSEVGKNAAVGGVIGLAANADGNRGDMAGGAVLGAGLMALITKIKEGSNEAESYTIEKRPGEFIKVIIDNKKLDIGDCVAVEEGRTTNLRKVADDMCGELVTAEIEEELNNSLAQAAEDCHDAKVDLIESDTADSLDGHLQRINVLCH